MYVGIAIIEVRGLLDMNRRAYRYMFDSPEHWAEIRLPAIGAPPVKEKIVSLKCNYCGKEGFTSSAGKRCHVKRYHLEERDSKRY